MERHTIGYKRNLIFWFLDSQKLMLPEAEKVLRCLMQSDQLLEKVILVDDVQFQRNGLLISARGASTYPFLFRFNGEYVYNVDEVVRLLQEGGWQELYVHLSLNRTLLCQNCGQESPGEQPRVNPGRKNIITRELLLKMIDEALDRRDRSAFYLLTNRLQRLEKTG